MNTDVMRRAAAAIREDYTPWPEHFEDGCCDAINYHIALADWLDNSADAIDGPTQSGCVIVAPGALAVARLYLGEPVLCHNDHPFAPGVSIDHAPGESDPRWCGICGEARHPSA